MDWVAKQFLGRLDKTYDVAIGVFDAGDQGAVTDVLGALVLRGAGGEEFLEAGVDVFDFPVADRTREATGVAIGIETKALVTDLELDIIWKVHGWLGPEEGAEERLGAIEILDGIDEGFDA
jgi:hypothetical protein